MDCPSHGEEAAFFTSNTGCPPAHRVRHSSPHRRPQHLSQMERPAFACVWELDVLLHEQQARIRHVLAVNPPQTGDYLADLYVWPPTD